MENSTTPNLFPTRIKMHLYGDRDENWEIGERLGLSEKAIHDNFRYILNKVEFDIEVYEDGKFRILSIDGKSIAS